MTKYSSMACKALSEVFNYKTLTDFLYGLYNSSLIKFNNI